MEARGEGREEKGARLSRRALARRVAGKLMLALAVLVTTNLIGSFLLESEGTLGGVAWEAFRQASDVDTVVVGASYAQRGIDPDELDSCLGSSTINLGSPAQPLDDSYLAVKSVLSRRHVRRVIVGIGCESMFSTWGLRSEVPYLQGMLQGTTLSEAAEVYLGRMTDPQYVVTCNSLNLLFPWAYDFTPSPQRVVTNLEGKLDDTTTLSSAEEQTKHWSYHGKGYGTFEVQFHPTRNDATSTSRYGNRPFLAARVDALLRICDLCREHGVECVVVATPHPTFDILAYGSYYPRSMGRLQRTVERHGAKFYDFNLYKGGRRLGKDDFSDFDHLRHAGARTFTSELAGILYRAERGQDVSKSFYGYDDWDSYLDSVDYVAGVSAEATVRGDGSVTVAATVRTGRPRRAQLRFEAKVGGSWVVLRDWGSATSVTWTPPAHGAIEVRVRARIPGADPTGTYVQKTFLR